MTTHSQNNIHKPQRKLNIHTQLNPNSITKPATVTQALKIPHWRKAISEEYDVLVRNRTWELVPPASVSNIVGCKWIFRIK